MVRRQCGILCAFLCLIIVGACGATEPTATVQDVSENIQTQTVELYGRSCLSSAGQMVYDELSSAVEEDATQTSFTTPVSEKVFENVLQAIRTDVPLLDDLTVTPSGGPVRSCSIAPRPKNTPQREDAIRHAAAPLLADLPVDTAGCALILHDRLLSRLTYRRGVAQPDDSTVYGALVNGVAICDGYSRSYQYLCQQAGIPCYMIVGRSTRGIPHSWNMVKLPQGWRYVDATWDESSYMRSYHDYFLISLEELLQEHTPADDTPPLPSGEGAGYYELCGYSADSDSQNMMDEIAEAFARQLYDFPPTPGEKALFLEIKLTGAQYRKGRERFQKELFPLVVDINAAAKRIGAPHLLETNGVVEYNFNDTTRVLTIFPVAKTDIEKEF